MVNNLMNLFPKQITKIEAEKLEQYLITYDLKYESIIKRCLEYMEKNKSISFDDRKHFQRAIELMVKQIIDRGIPPYFLERNLSTCEFIHMKEPQIEQIEENFVIYGGYDPRNNILYYYGYLDEYQFSAYIKNFVRSIKTFILENNKQAINKLMYYTPGFLIFYHELQHLASSYSNGIDDNIFCGLSAVGSETQTMNSLRKTLNLILEQLKLKIYGDEEITDFLNEGLTQILTIEALKQLRCANTSTYLENIGAVRKTHKRMNVSLDKAIECYYTANIERYYELINKGLEESNEKKHKTLIKI